LVVSFNYDGNYCLSGGQDKTLKLWNPHKGTLITTYKGHGYELLDLHVSQDNSQIVSCGGEKLIFMWDVATARVIRKLRGPTNRVNCVRFSEDGSIIVAGSYDKIVRIWDGRSNNNDSIQDLTDARDSVTSVFISQYEILTSSVDGSVRNYDIRAGRLRTDHLGQPVTSMTLSNDRNCILCSCLDSTIRLLDKNSGDLLNQYKGHLNTGYKIASGLTYTDAHIFSGSEDHKIYYWDLVSGSPVMQEGISGHNNIVCGMSYHPSEPYLLSSSVDGTIRFWDIP